MRKYGNYFCTKIYSCLELGVNSRFLQTFRTHDIGGEFKKHFFVYRCSQDKHKIVSNITVDHVKAFARNMFKQPMFIQTLVQGNIIPDEAKEMFEMISKAFNVRSHSIFFVQVGMKTHKYASNGNQHFSLYHVIVYLVLTLPKLLTTCLKVLIFQVIFNCLKSLESLLAFLNMRLGY